MKSLLTFFLLTSASAYALDCATLDGTREIKLDGKKTVFHLKKGESGFGYDRLGLLYEYSLDPLQASEQHSLKNGVIDHKMTWKCTKDEDRCGEMRERVKGARKLLTKAPKSEREFLACIDARLAAMLPKENAPGAPSAPEDVHGHK